MRQSGTHFRVGAALQGLLRFFHKNPKATASVRSPWINPFEVVVYYEVMDNIDDKKTIEILTSLLQNGILSNEEDEAVRSAIGILSWTSLAASRLKAIKAKRAKGK